MTDDEFGWRFAGITDGEGCFFMGPHSKALNAYRCAFIIGLRADDKPLLALLRDTTGLGRIHDVIPTESTLRRRPGTNPQAHWWVSRKADCLELVRLFDRYPPISKKAREYEVWRRAVVAWQGSRWDVMRECWIALGLLRSFSADELADVLIDDPQLSLEVLA